MKKNNKGGFNLQNNESEILGVKIERIDYVESLQINVIKNIILDNKLDLLRIKLDAKNRDSFLELENLNIPYHILNISNVYRIELSKLEQPIYKPNILSFEKFNIKNQLKLDKLIRNVFSEVPGSYYISPIFNKISKYSEINAMVKYTIDKSKDSEDSSITYFIKNEKEYIGFFNIRIYKQHAEGNLFGILEDFRGKEFAHDIINFIMQLLFDNNKKYFDVNIQLHNLPSLNTHISLGYKPIKALLNVHISSLLSKSIIEPIKQMVIYNYEINFIELITRNFKKEISKKMNLVNFKHCFADSLKLENEYELITSIPYKTKDEIYIVSKFENSEGIKSFIHLVFRK